MMHTHLCLLIEILMSREDQDSLMTDHSFGVDGLSIYWHGPSLCHSGLAITYITNSLELSNYNIIYYTIEYRHL
jgi:hypothetical protein